MRPLLRPLHAKAFNLASRLQISSAIIYTACFAGMTGERGVGR